MSETLMVILKMLISYTYSIIYICEIAYPLVGALFRRMTTECASICEPKLCCNSTLLLATKAHEGKGLVGLAFPNTCL